MNKREQCLKCRYYNDNIDVCGKTDREPLENSSSCDLYQEKMGVTNGLNSPSNNEDSPIRGWLVFFCFAMGLGAILAGMYNIFSGDFYQDYGGSFWLKAVDVSIGVIGLIIAAYTIYAIIKRKNNAVFFAKAYVVMVFVTNLIVLLFNFTEEGSYMTSMRRTISSLIWGVIWFLYLIFSEQVNTRFPKEKRVAGAKEWLIVLSMLYVPLFFMMIYWIGGDNTKVALRQSVIEVNSELRFTEGFDSVAYDEKSNIYSYYFQCTDEEAESLGVRDENDIKTMLLCDMQADEETKDFLATLENAKATLRYVYQTPYGGIVKTVEISPNEMKTAVSGDQMKESALNMIEHEAREANADCPYVIDDWLIWNSCTFDRQRVRMQFTYSLPYSKRDIDRDAMDGLLEESRNNMIENCKDNEVYKMAGLTIEIEYRDKYEELIDNTVIGPNDY